MKSRKIYILTLCLSLTVNTFATHTEVKEVTDSWLKKSASGEKPGINEGTPQPGNPESPSPIGDALLVLASLGVAYGFYVFGKKKRRI